MAAVAAVLGLFGSDAVFVSGCDCRGNDGKPTARPAAEEQGAALEAGTDSGPGRREAGAAADPNPASDTRGAGETFGDVPLIKKRIGLAMVNGLRAFRAVSVSDWAGRYDQLVDTLATDIERAASDVRSLSGPWRCPGTPSDADAGGAWEAPVGAEPVQAVSFRALANGDGGLAADLLVIMFDAEGGGGDSDIDSYLECVTRALSSGEDGGSSLPSAVVERDGRTYLITSRSASFADVVDSTARRLRP